MNLNGTLHSITSSRYAFALHLRVHFYQRGIEWHAQIRERGCCDAYILFIQRTLLYRQVLLFFFSLPLRWAWHSIQITNANIHVYTFTRNSIARITIFNYNKSMNWLECVRVFGLVDIIAAFKHCTFVNRPTNHK